MKFIFLLCLLHLGASQAPVTPTNCILEQGPTRKFRTALEYQGTKFSFNPLHPGYRGNVVEITALGMKVLTKNLFVSFDSDHIVKINLQHNGVINVQDGAFQGLFCLQELDLGNNEISLLSEGSFEGLGNLKKLDLSRNALASVPDEGLAFLTLKNLTVLNLSHNRISSVRTPSFMTLGNLETLDLSFNRLQVISPGAFDYLTALNLLLLNDNNLVEVSPENWKGLSSLQTLNLSGNFLSSFDTVYNLSFAGLKALDLSRNTLKTFNAFGARRNLPLLATLDLRENSFSCEEVASLRHFLLDSKVGLVEPLECDVATRRATPSGSSVSTTRQPGQVGDFKDVFQKFEDVNFRRTQLERRVDYIETILAVLILLIMIFVACYCSMRTNACQNLYYRLTGSVRMRHEYLDNDDETVLLSRR